MDRAGSDGERMNPRPYGRAVLTMLLVAGLASVLLPAVLTAESTPETPGSPPNVADSIAYIANGTVNAIAHSGSTTYIGGTFTAVGPRTGHGTLVSMADATPTSGFPDIAGGSVLVVEPDGSGGWYVGGSFTSVGGIDRNRIAHINADLNLDPSFDPNANDTVRALVLAGNGGTIYAGGDFTSIGGQSRNRIAAIGTGTGNATSWDPNANGIVRALEFTGDGNTVYAGGDFTEIDSQSRRRLAALSTSTGSATSWDPGVNDAVNTMVLSSDDTIVYIGGDFTNVGNGFPLLSRWYAAAINASTGAGTSWNPSANATVNTIVLSPDGNTAYLGGSFSTMGLLGTTRNNIAATNTAAAGSLTAWDPNANSTVEALAVSSDGNTVYTGGDFTTMNGNVDSNRIASLDNTNGDVASWDPSADSTVRALAVSGTKAFVGGDFISIGIKTRNYLAVLDADGRLTDCNLNVSGGTVNTLAVSPNGGTAYVGGSFTSIGGQSRNRIASLSSNCQVTEWNPVANAAVNALAVSTDGSTIYAGGDFTTIGSGNTPPTRNRLAAIDASSGSVANWNPNANGTVNTIALSPDGNTVYAGGDFTVINGDVDRNRTTVIDSGTGTATSWDPNAGASVNAIAFMDSTVYLGGLFTSIDGQGRNRVAALNNTNGSASDWNPDANAEVRSLAGSRAGNTVFTGGDFTSIGGQSRNRLAGVDVTSGDASNWNPNVDGSVNVVVASGSTVYVGGSFDKVGAYSNKGFAQFTARPTNMSTPSVSGSGLVGEPLTCQSGSWDDENATISYQWRRNGSSVSGATSASYTPTSDDAGTSVDCRVTATNSGGSTAATSGTLVILESEAQPEPAQSVPVAAPDTGFQVSGLSIKPRCYRSKAKSSSKKKSKSRNKKRRAKSSSKKRKNRKKSRKRAKKSAGSSVKLNFTISRSATISVSIRRRVNAHTRRRCPSSRSKSKREKVFQPGSYIEVASFTQEGSSGKNSLKMSLLKKAKKKRAKKKRANKRNALIASTTFSIGGASGKNSIGLGSTSGLRLGNLRPGTYKAYVTVTDALGNHAVDVAKFWVLQSNRF